MNDLCLSVLHGAARCSPKKHLSDSENRLNFILPSQSEYLLSCLLLMFASEAERGWRRNGKEEEGSRARTLNSSAVSLIARSTVRRPSGELFVPMKHRRRMGIFRRDLVTADRSAELAEKFK